MKVNLVPQKDHEALTNAITLEPRKLYDMALDVLNPLWSKSPELITAVKFVYEPENEVSGEFQVYAELLDASEKVMIINLAKIKTYRDLLYTIYHEWRHAFQLNRFGWDTFYEMTLKLDYNYEKSFIEGDADRYAFEKESETHYKNFIINKNVPYSIFIVRKKLNG